MTLTNTDCESILLESVYLTSTNQSVSLEITYNCDALYVIDMDVVDADYTATPEDVGTSDVFPDGVYQFKFKITQEDGTKVEDSICKFINCASDCLMTSIFTNIGTDPECTIKALAYFALTIADECPGCSCADLCALYNATGLNPSTNDSGCGCS